jgi:hypothetical protein
MLMSGENMLTSSHQPSLSGGNSVDEYDQANGDDHEINDYSQDDDEHEIEDYL